MGDFSEAINNFDLINRMYGRRESSMDAEDLIVDDDAQGKEIEHVGEVMPHVCVAVFARAFGIESIRLSDAPRLMVATDEVDAVRVSEFQADK